jgi:hypothetical protein
MPFGEPENSGGPYPKELLDHLLLVWAVDYIDDAPSKFSRSGAKSDVIVVDLVDLDDVDPMTRQPGYMARSAWWRPSKLIQSLKRRLGSPDPVLAWMRFGTADPGMNAPYVLVSATGDPQSVARAEAWMAANPGFAPSSVSVPPMREQGAVRQPEAEPTSAARAPSPLERLAQQAQRGADRLPPPSPGREQIPF